MANKMIGVDIGGSELKLARLNGGVVSLDSQRLPENMIKNGQVQLPRSMTRFLGEARSKAHMPRTRCTLVLPDSVAVCRRLTLPAMTAEQLAINLPYEFRDFIGSESAEYIYDYAVIDVPRDAAGEPTGIEVMAAAAPKDTLNDYAQLFSGTGLRLGRVLPREMAYIELIRSHEASQPASPAAVGEQPMAREYCIVDIGHTATRVHIFSGIRLMASRVIDVGGAAINAAIADAMHIDEYLADIHKRENNGGVQNSEEARGVYGRIAIEILRSVNFYRFNSQNTELNDIYFSGGGAAIPALRETICTTVSLTPHSISELFAVKCADGTPDGLLDTCALAAAAALDPQQEGGVRIGFKHR